MRFSSPGAQVNYGGGSLTVPWFGVTHVSTHGEDGMQHNLDAAAKGQPVVHLPQHYNYDPLCI